MLSGWIDTHCHLEMLSKDTSQVLARAKKFGVDSIVTIATDKESSQKIFALTKQYSDIYSTVGIHPHEAKKSIPTDFDFIQSSLKKQEKILAVGECGYDFHYQHSSFEEQKEVFEKQLRIALECDYPVVVHSRKAEKETISSLLPFLKKGLKVLLHSFTSSQELADFGKGWGCYFSFNGILTFPKSEELREIFRSIPFNRILLETDSPYLSPVPLRGKENFPENIPVIGKFVAELLNLEEKEVLEVTTNNAKSFYRGL